MSLASVTVFVASSEVIAIDAKPLIPAEDKAVSTAPLLAKAPAEI